MPVLYWIALALVAGGSIVYFLWQQANRQKEFWEATITKIQTFHQNSSERLRNMENQGQAMQQAVMQKLHEAQLAQQQALAEHRARFDERQMESLKILQDTLQQGTQETRNGVKEALQDYAKEMGTRLEQLTATTDARLREINGQVERRLTEGFEKTNATFSDIIKRLALIDAAQKQITELSSNVVSLQEILSDKRSRGAFGEIQLSALIRNMIPEQHFSFQHTLSNGKRADCMLFLPEPTGNIAIDAKFPLENFKLLMDNTLPETDRRTAEQQFRNDIKKHIQDIAEKYIVPEETADGAVMFIPAEAIFAEIHAHYPDLVETAYRAKVWLVSPTTMMAILTTARAVLKDAATRQQMHIIQKHLHFLAKDFERFQSRMDDLARHIEQAHTDVVKVHTSARKISDRFGQIEQVDVSVMTETLTEMVEPSQGEQV